MSFIEHGGQRVEWSLADRLNQLAAATAYAFQPKRIAGMPNVLRAMAARRIAPRGMRPAVPDPRCSAAVPAGFAGICPDLSPATMLAGYRAGVFQTSHAGPYKWWSPDERMVLFLDKLHMEKNLKRKLKQGRYSVTFDKAFTEVVEHCAGPRQQRRIQLTWLLPEVIDAFQRLHGMGHAHSLEVWGEDGELAGGLFGVSFGDIFVTESQFAHQRDASKIAFAVLNRHLQTRGYVLNDVRLWSAHLERLGCELIPRDEYLAIVERFGQGSNWQGEWMAEEALCSGTWDPAQEDGWSKAHVYLALSDASESAQDQVFADEEAWASDSDGSDADQGQKEAVS